MKKRIVLKALLASLMASAASVAPVALASSYDDFFAAIKRDDVPALQRLAQRGFDLNTIDPAGQHPLFIALRDQSDKVARYLLDQPVVKVEYRNAKGESPLMMAALKGKLDLVQRLIERKAEVNKPGWAPLHYAVTHPEDVSLSITRLLLEHHAFIDAQSPNGSTPLMMAAMYGRPEVVKLLLEEGADPLMKNEQGLGAIDFAQRSQRQPVAEAIAAAVRAKQPAGRW